MDYPSLETFIKRSNLETCIEVFNIAATYADSTRKYMKSEIFKFFTAEN